MSETHTAERVQADEENLVDAAARAEQERQAKQVAAFNPGAAGFEEFQLAVRRMLGLEDASDGEMRLFWHLCQKSGLDPFNREIYMIGRNTEVANWEPVNPDEPDGQKRKVVRWVTKYTVQVAINGFRKRAREIADTKGIELEMSEPLWCGDDGVWRDVWPEKTPPTASKFTVYRDGKPFTFIAHYDEYVQMAGQPAGPNSMWKKMPRNQTRKCAEANAIQMAFPDELGGLILEDAAQPDIIDQDGNTVEPEPRRRPGGAGVGGMRAARERRESQRQEPQQTVVAAESAEPTQERPADDKKAEETRRRWMNRMFQLLKEGDCEDREDQLIVMVGAAKAFAEASNQPDPDLQLGSRNDIPDEQLRAVVTQLNHWSKAGTLGSEITELLNRASIAQMEAEARAAEAAAGSADENAG